MPGQNQACSILHIDLAPVKELISLQRRCSNNLNQVAIHAHTYGVYPEEMFKEFDRKEAAYRLRTYRHKAYYSLDRDDGLEHEAVFVALSPHELYERKVTMQELHAAIASLPDKQAKRIYAHFILGMTKQDIARAEGVHEKVVRVAIERGLRRLEKILKNSL